MFFLDTNTCIYFIKGVYPSVRDQLLSYRPAEIRIPAPVRAELLYGARRSNQRGENERRIAAFLHPFATVSFDATAADHYADIRAKVEAQGTPIGPNDLIIAAIVRAHEGTLVTHNTREFSRVSGLSIVDWVGRAD